MSRITDLLAIEYIARSHCADPQCAKCSARARWNRRKGWRSGNTIIRESGGKKVTGK